MNITLKHTEVKNLELKKVEEPITNDEVKFSYSTGYNDELKRSFIVILEYSMMLKEEGFSLSTNYVAYFETDEDIGEDFQKSHFPLVNAPAIAYPFLRSFISTLTVNAGYGAILIPTVNFQALAKERNEES
jgi:preprotein translocase subunit SecB